MSSYLIPVIALSLVLYGAYKKVNVYDCFVFGAKSSMQLIVSTLPNLIAIFILIELFSASGLSDMLNTALSPIFSALGIPKQLTGLVLIKPFSGSGSIAMLQNIFSVYGVDSYLARCASAIVGSSEAIFYVSSVYFVKTNVKKFGIVIPICLFANFVGAVVACNICKII